MRFLEKMVMLVAAIASLAGFLLAVPVFLLARVCRELRILRWLPVLALISLIAFHGNMEEEIDYWLWNDDISYTQMYRYSSLGSWWFRRDELWRYVMERKDSSREEFVAFFLKHGAAPNDGLYRFFFDISESFRSNDDEDKVLQLLLAAGAAPDEPILAKTPLEHAVLKKKFALGLILLQAGASVRAWKDDGGRTVLHLAAKGGADPEFLGRLAAAMGPSAWQNADGSGRSAIHYLSTPRQLEMFASSREILEQPSLTGANLLHYSLQAGNLDLFDRLLKMGFAANTPDASGCPPLAYTRDFATFSRLRALMPPDFSLSGESRQRLWLRALHSGSEDFIRAIIGEGVDLRAPLKNKNFPIHEVVRFRHAPGLIQVLAGAGADIHALDSKKNTPLHQAIEQRNASAAEILLDLGANTRVLNADRQTPLSLANQTLDAVKRIPRNLSMNGIREEMEACRPWEKLISRLKNLSQVAEVEVPGDETLPTIQGAATGQSGSAYDSRSRSEPEREKLCPTCGGSGNCQKCYGGGEVTNFATMKRVRCSQCRGNGTCTNCNGKGRVR